VSKAAWDFFMNGMSDELKGNYLRYIQRKVKDGFTVIFEYVAPSNRIVIFYDRPQLILTAVRSNFLGIYQMYDFMAQDAKTYGIPVVQPVTTEHSTITDLAAHIKDLKDAEGVVVRFSDGKMVKMKAEDYVRQHKALDGLRHEKDVLQLILRGQLDDVLPLVSDEIRVRLEQFRDDVLSNVKKFDERITMRYAELKVKHGEDRKAFALEAKQHPRSSLLFALYNSKYDLLTFLVGDKYSPGNLKTQKEVDSVRDIIGERSWYDYGAMINTGDA
jgi:T4 RnlA family RNA ligase